MQQRCAGPYLERRWQAVATPGGTSRYRTQVGEPVRDDCVRSRVLHGLPAPLVHTNISMGDEWHANYRDDIVHLIILLIYTREIFGSLESFNKKF